MDMDAVTDYLEKLSVAERQSSQQESLGLEYAGIHDFLLKNGHQFSSAPLGSVETGWLDITGWESHLSKKCYANAQIISLTCDAYGGVDLKYVEGVVVNNRLPIPVWHAWMTANGKVIDTTLKVFGDLGDWTYFGIIMDTSVCQHVLVGHGSHISLIDDYECRWPMLKIS